MNTLGGVSVATLMFALLQLISPAQPAVVVWRSLET